MTELGRENATMEKTRVDGKKCLIVVPCLNEEDHVSRIIDILALQADEIDARIALADGGSEDRTRIIISDRAKDNPRIMMVDNPGRIQSAGINTAIDAYGHEVDYLIRIDAHAVYPRDYCRRLIEEAERTGADSVVVAMKTMGQSLFQQATAAAQNSKLGNGGSKHRERVSSCWTDHGHHALMSVAAFKAVGGYDESFSHNEDAELDFRLRQAGFCIWLTDKTVMSYFPRDTASGLFRQYLAYGRGRARNMLKHCMVPRVRQILPLMIAPVLAGCALAVFSWLAVIPAVIWALVCILYGVFIAIRERKAYGPLIGFSAMIMHLAWSLGFWLQLLATRKQQRGRAV